MTVKTQFFAKKNEWMNEWMKEWINEWMNEWIRVRGKKEGGEE